MKKHTSEEAFYERMRNLASVNETSTRKSNNSLGTLVDYKRAADGVAYGIIKEQHHYYIKKGGLNENLSEADFAYIGGQSNITDFQYGKLSEAEKQRNMLFATINEGLTPNTKKTGSKKVRLTEDKAGQEIDMAASKVDALDAATAAADAPVEDPVDGGAAEMDAGIEAMGGDEPAPVDDAPIDGADDMGMGGAPMGDDPLAGGEEDPMGDDPLAGDEEGIEGEEGDGEEVAVEDPESEATREIEKVLGKLTNTLRKTELTEPQVKSYVNSFLSAFKDDFPDIDIEDRKEMAEKITKVVPPEDIEDLGQNVEDTDGEEGLPSPEEGLEEEEGCSECGGFAQYAESRGYDANSIQECGEEEMTNLVSGYANAHGEGQNDGDFKAVAIFITPEILEKLKSEYGHEEFAGEVEPFSNDMNESSEEDRQAQINELFGGLKNLGQKAAQGIKQGVGNAAQSVKQGVANVGQGIADKAGQVQQAVGQAATNVKQTYHAGELGGEVKKVEKLAADLGAQIGSLNKRMEKAGGQPINVGSVLQTIKNQVSRGGGADLGKFSTVQEEGIPVDSVEVQPDLEVTELEEDVTIKVGEKAGKKLSPDNVPQVEMKESEEKEGEDLELDVDALDVSDETSAEETPELSTDSGEEKPAFSAGFEPMGGGVVKPDGAATTTIEITKDSVNVEMNESLKKLREGLEKISKNLATEAPVKMNETEIKLRKYIRNRLEEHAGIRKANLNEGKKSTTLLKLDNAIDKQFNLYESKVKEKIDKIK